MIPLGLAAVTAIIKNEAKAHFRNRFLRMLLGTLAASILGTMLAGKPTITGQWVIRAGEGTIRANEETNRANQEFLMLPHPLTILKYKNIIWNTKISKRT